MTLHVGLVGPLPPPYGGMANQVNQLYQLLQKEKNLKVSFLQTNEPHRNKFIRNIKGVRACFRLVSYMVKTIKFVKKVDVIHLFSNSGWSWQLFSAPVIWIAWLNKTPVIVNYRGGEARSYFEKSIKWVAPSLNKVNKIVVPSGYLHKVFDDFNYETQIIPNIINLERFHPTLKKIDIQFPHLVITRNLESIYGIDTAIKAAAILKKHIPEFQLSIAGSGPQENELLSLSNQLGLKNNVVFTGKLTPEEVANLYQEADIMLNPTTVDNMPNSVLEAMASGVAVITTNVGGIPYVVEDNKTALLVKVNDFEQMAVKIMAVINDEQLFDNLRRSSLNEVKQYSWDYVGKQWIDLYKSLGRK